MAIFCQSCANEVASQYKYCPACGGKSFAPYKPQPQFVENGSRAGGRTEPVGVGPGLRTGYGGFWRRLAAYFVDFLVLLVPGVIIGSIVGFLSALMGIDDATAEAFAQLLGVGLAWAYFAGMESSARQGTLGKRALGLRVCDMNGQRISFGKATGRFFAKFLSAVILCIGFLMIAFTERKQGLHDKLAGTVVLHQPE